MEFDENDITIMETLTPPEAKAYILFLLSERRRHEKDISEIDEKIKWVEKKFNMGKKVKDEWESETKEVWVLATMPLGTRKKSKSRRVKKVS